MSSEIETAQPHTIASGQVEKANVEHVGDLKTEANFRADAMEAETAESSMTVLEAVKAYPMACWWAFIMSSTIIVSDWRQRILHVATTDLFSSKHTV